MGRIWREYRLELFLGLCILLGVFLLVEELNIRQTLLDAAAIVIGVLGSGAASAFRSLVNFVTMRSTSDLVGLGLIVTAVVLLYRRERVRLLTSPRYSDKACPVCGSSLHRVHRASGDRILALFLPIRRYACANHDCGWRGLRIVSSKRHRRKPAEPTTKVASD